jgi:type IV pilus assembly protein PilB
MIIASGPTGSGKTTSLYTILKLMKKDGLNISTLEDPVEYTLEGVNQVQINPRADLNFPTGLRSLLRQDPDIIMVGEVRDSETAIMAANAALTGHLVLTTIHANDAAYAFIRLLEMKVEDFVVASTINLIIAQRLVRKICPFCAAKEKISPIILNKIKERKDIITALEAKKPGLAKKIEKQKFKIGRGCKRCLNTGYSGRIGIYELLSPSKKTRDLVLSHESAEKIKNVAEKEGFEDMLADALDKVFSGTTTFSEILRATKNV